MAKSRLLENESESADCSTTLEPGAIVYTMEPEYQDEWFFKWAGVVTRVLERERKVFVEFMGFGHREHRTKVFHPREVQLYTDGDGLARLYRVAKHLKIPQDDGRGHWRKRPVVEDEDNALRHLDRPEESGD